MFWKDSPAESRVNSAADTSFVSSSSARKPTESLTRGKLREIQDLRVGDRVLAENPEVGAAERAAYVEPDWRRWLQISLQMPKADGSVLEMELLRPDEWLIEQATLLVDEPGIEYVRADLPAEGDAEVEEVRSGCGPVRPAFADLARRLELAEACGLVASGFVVQMDLPELGLTGEAVVVEVQPAPVVKAGTGRLVTATFKHSSGDVIDLVVAGDGSQETLGTTSNHPFWSVDRQDYVQAGKLELGERLQTYSGDTKRVVSKLARPGPEPVFNLEVHAEHVYYVGQQGLLVHNSQDYEADFGNGVTYRDSLDKLGAPSRGVAARYGGVQQRSALLNRVREAGGLNEAKGLVHAFREMKRIGYSLEDVSLAYRGKQGVDMVFSNAGVNAIVEAKAGASLSLLKTYKGGLRQGSDAYNISRLQRYMQYGDGVNDVFARQLLKEAKAGDLESFAAFYRSRSLYELPRTWPSVPAIRR